MLREGTEPEREEVQPGRTGERSGDDTANQAPVEDGPPEDIHQMVDADAEATILARLRALGYID